MANGHQRGKGPFRINRYVPGNAYILETLEGEEYSRALNKKYLKKYYPSVWVDAYLIDLSYRLSYDGRYDIYRS